MVAQFKKGGFMRNDIGFGAVAAVLSLPPGARRVKKICRWHIFSQSGEKYMIATRARGGPRQRWKEYSVQKQIRCRGRLRVKIGFVIILLYRTR